MQVAHPETSRSRLGQFIERPAFQRGILLLIVINAAILGMQTSAALVARWGEALVLLDSLIPAVFVAEITARIYVHRAAFFRDPGVCSTSAWSPSPGAGQRSVQHPACLARVAGDAHGDHGAVDAPRGRRTVVGNSGLGSIAMVLALVFYVSAVIATGLFAADFPSGSAALVVRCTPCFRS